ncbi:MAG: hypothetical protein NC132_05300 [Corallococcus sp.]|nr:hypothetical protein [Corallococcus sp.]MCM1359954.1 hypothetical protein [Corallococcus sp.]MCM1395510.1 hypothetical protein [Corallococcus sp.]
MKKLSLILLLALALSLGLAACNQTTPTAIVARWYDNEHYEFNITKADLDAEAKDGYAKEYTVRGEANPNQMDEKVPEDLRGTYVMDIKVEDKVCTFTTEMTLVSLYTADYYNNLPAKIKTDLETAGLVLDETETLELFGETANGKAIRSTTTTLVKFANDKGQRPSHSEKEYNGYYFGETEQEVSASKIVVDYNLDKNKVSVSVDGKKAEENDVSFNNGANIIDANQLLLYIRSLEKSESSFQDSPSVQVYDPVYNVVRTASFSMTYLCQTFIEYKHDKTTGEGEDAVTSSVVETLKAKLTCVAAVIDGQVFMVQMNLPATVNKDAKLDVFTDASTDYNRYTTVRFRVGAKTFELVDYDGIKDANGNKVGAQIVENLKAAAK